MCNPSLSASHLSLQHTPALTLPPEPHSVYLQPCYTLSTTAPTAQSRKCYQRQCTSGWLCSATLRVEHTGPYLSVVLSDPLQSFREQFSTCPVLRTIYNTCISFWKFISAVAIKLAVDSGIVCACYLSFFPGWIWKLIHHKAQCVLLWDRCVNLFSMWICLLDCAKHKVCCRVVYKLQHVSAAHKHFPVGKPWLEQSSALHLHRNPTTLL